MTQPYKELIENQWDRISELYNQFAEQRPIILLDVQAREIHAFPAQDFMGVLDEKSRPTFEEQYQRAVASRQMVLCVRDTENKQFLTYTLKLEDDGDQPDPGEAEPDEA